MGASMRSNICIELVMFEGINLKQNGKQIQDLYIYL